MIAFFFFFRGGGRGEQQKPNIHFTSTFSLVHLQIALSRLGECDVFFR